MGVFVDHMLFPGRRVGVGVDEWKVVEGVILEGGVVGV